LVKDLKGVNDASGYSIGYKRKRKTSVRNGRRLTSRKELLLRLLEKQGERNDA